MKPLSYKMAEALREIAAFKWSSEPVNAIKYIARKSLSEYEASLSNTPNAVNRAANKTGDVNDTDFVDIEQGVDNAELSTALDDALGAINKGGFIGIDISLWDSVKTIIRSAEKSEARRAMVGGLKSQLDSRDVYRDKLIDENSALRARVAELEKLAYYDVYSDDGATRIERHDRKTLLHGCSEENARLKEELAALKKGHEWRDISSAPRDGTKVLVVDEDVLHVSWFSEDGWVISGDMQDYFIEPKQWQPIRQPPESEA